MFIVRNLPNNLACKNPKLAIELHPKKNGTLTPNNLKPHSRKKVWWLCSKNSKHEWESTVDNRSKGNGCPFCAGRKVDDTNNLQYLYPKIAKSWHPSLNENLKATEVTPFSNKKIWWLCLKDPSHIWKTTIAHRTNGTGCPYCKRVKIHQINTLALKNPQLSNEWNFEKNRPLTPEKVSINSRESVYWNCLENQNHPPFKAPIFYRHREGSCCPLCRKPRPPAYEQSLKNLYPEIAAEFHKTKNGKLSPRNLTAKSGQIVWWKCKKNSKHEWPTRVSHRTNGHGCPHCSSIISKENIRILSELQGLLPNLTIEPEVPINNKMPADILIKEIKVVIEYDSSYHHQNKYNADLRKAQTINKFGYRQIRLRHKNLKNLPKKICTTIIHDDKITISLIQEILILIKDLLPNHHSLIKNYSKKDTFQYEYLYRKNLSLQKKPIPGKSLKEKNPEHSKFWHPSKNYNLTPEKVYASGHIKAWWLCPTNFEHEWEMTVADMTRKKPRCPYCSKSKVSKEYNLAIIHPQLMDEWDYERNSTLDPTTLSPGTGKKIHWICRKNPNHRWEAIVNNRRKGQGCPLCAGKRPSKDYNLLTTNPELTKEWHPTLNNPLTPKDVTPGSHKKVWWQCKNKHEWQAAINNRTKGRGCAACTREKYKKKIKQLN